MGLLGLVGLLAGEASAMCGSVAEVGGHHSVPRHFYFREMPGVAPALYVGVDEFMSLVPLWQRAWRNSAGHRFVEVWGGEPQLKLLVYRLEGLEEAAGTKYFPPQALQNPGSWAVTASSDIDVTITTGFVPRARTGECGEWGRYYDIALRERDELAHAVLRARIPGCGVSLLGIKQVAEGGVARLFLTESCGPFAWVIRGGAVELSALSIEGKPGAPVKVRLPPPAAE